MRQGIRQDAFLRLNHRPFNQILNLTYISRPGMTLKRSHGVGRNAVDLLSHPPAENLHEVPFRDDLVLACAGG